MNAQAPFFFFCNGVSSMSDLPDNAKILNLSYFKQDKNHLVNLKLPDFVRSVYHLPPRILDLLEITAYIFAADRWAPRGRKDALEFHAWARSMNFIISVRDAEFWNRQVVKEKLSKALAFMTGDAEYSFRFIPGHSTPPSGLFDREEFDIQSSGPVSVVLFSGGLDSLARVLNRLRTTDEDIYLISHRSGLPSTKRTQNKLVEALKNSYPGRIHNYSFECGLSHKRGAEETQRTRAFLFNSIAFSLAYSLSQNRFFAYENGITSLNLLRRQDLINGRASRTTHPKTHELISSFLSELADVDIKVLNPFWQLTKADVFRSLETDGGKNLINSSVSCSKTFQRMESGTHCGGCFQCIDRRLAGYASGLEDCDNCGIYSRDILIDPIESPETRTTALDYIRQATRFASITDDQFYREHLYELSDVVDHIDADGEADAIDKIWALCNRHGNQVMMAIKEIRQKHDDPRFEVKAGSLLQLIACREYLKSDPKRLAECLATILHESIPIAFKTRQPSKEDELNDHIDAILRTNKEDFQREFPSTTFALSKVIPDHEARHAELLIEAKYIRAKTAPSKVSEGIAADITKYPKERFILFVIYDPDRGIADDTAFRNDIINKRDCIVAIIR